MSKKMLKRSLALGALMAFVITGQAWAEENPYSNKSKTGASVHGVVLKLSGSNNSYTGELFEGNKGEATGAKGEAMGGAIFVDGDLTINNCQFINNEMKGVANAYGGAISHQNGKLEIVGTTFDGNKTSRSSGGDCYGSAVYSSAGTEVNITNSTFKNQIGGRAVFIKAGTKATFTGNVFESNARGGINVDDANTEAVFVGTNEFLDNESNSIKAKGKVTFTEESNTVFSGNACDIDICNNALVLLEQGSVVTAGSGLNNDDGKNASGKLIVNGTLGIGGESNITNLEGNGTLKFLDAVDINVVNNYTDGLTLAAAGKANDAVSGDAEKLLENFELNGKENTKMVLEEGNLQGEKVVELKFATDEAGNVTGLEEAIVISESVNSKSDAVSDAGMTLKGHWRAHMNDMNKRMGELRMANGEHGVWTRMVRGESEYQGAKMQYNQYQLGYDERLSVDKRWTVGAAVTFSEGDASYGSGSTDDKSTAFAIYGSKLNNDGTFVDLIARYAHLESDLDDRNYGTGDYSTNGMSVSAEFGKRIQQGNGLWIEPQVELTYGSVDSADVAFDGGAYKAHYDSMDSFIARAGFALGKDIKQGNVYARASYLYDFDGETETQFEGGKAISEDFGGGWWEVGVGANINLSKATYIYADIEKTFGGEVDTNWQWNLGVRYSF